MIDFMYLTIMTLCSYHLSWHYFDLFFSLLAGVTMLSAMETAVKCEVDLPLNLKTHVSTDLLFIESRGTLRPRYPRDSLYTVISGDTSYICTIVNDLFMCFGGVHVRPALAVWFVRCFSIISIFFPPPLAEFPRV